MDNDMTDFLDMWGAEAMNDDFLDLALGVEWNPSPAFDASLKIKQDDDSPPSAVIDIGNLAQAQPIPIHATIPAFGQLCQPDDSHNTSCQWTRRRPQTTPPPPQAVRFSLASIKILKTWLSTHAENPYPRVEEVEAFQRQTNLSRQQIMTWFANARRRSKTSTTHRPTTRDSRPIHTPVGTPRWTDNSTFEHHMDPLQRWTNSPPEQEPADVDAIARALTNASGLLDHRRSLPSTQTNSPRHAYNNSSASSVATSDSASASSAYSHVSGVSLRSLESRRKTEKRRRRTKKRHQDQSRQSQAQQTTGRNHDVLPRMSDPYQCTFCTQTFKTKHNWQRHEKSLHLSLERWECSPDGPNFRNAQFESACIYCGKADFLDMDAHLQSHNYEACQVRTPEERTFYRKDHLRQHLKLVHQIAFEPVSMDGWKSEVMEVRSRCGFCGLSIDTWAKRVEHLAEHFKSGKTMADWEGDWGFEPHVLEMVENSIAPYLIDYERNSPCPFEALQQTPDGPATAYELLRLETECFCSNHMNLHHLLPSYQEVQYEMCCIIFASDILSRDTVSQSSSWLRDLLMSSEEICKEAKVRPIRSATRARFTDLRTHGRESIFERCHMEALLHQHVKSMTLLGTDIKDETLRQQACEIIWSMNANSPDSSDMLANLLISLVYDSTTWLNQFRQRAGLPIDGRENTSTQTGARSQNPTPRAWTEGWISRVNSDTGISIGASEAGAGFKSSTAQIQGRFLDDSSYYRRLIRELTRFVASATSQRNPNKHVPTDLELQHQARWILYDDDDPWNQTPADNLNWIKDFKDSIGLLDE